MATPAPILVFDIETIPDVATGKRLYPELAGLSDNDAMTKLMALREQDVGPVSYTHLTLPTILRV